MVVIDGADLTEVALTEDTSAANRGHATGASTTQTDQLSIVDGANHASLKPTDQRLGVQEGPTTVSIVGTDRL